ncbi:CRISPR-associated endoribonuclease Cas6 [Sporomusa sp. KB1]|jgi:CRISPR-associated endoribonuclease Cas6|uniref:CRISPR-associated endoribonuclease Cas6 n=1 Tax=Sporomusa sp. KB1 TaxID=943346 RepID=UPI0011A35A04|nr:CRISPR-associated endoribonuclease Cas6 [Sporomusa sp. KB1]TWH47926.1 CRISPR-associated Cas6 family protein [Sporomusa sp. KB1]
MNITVVMKPHQNVILPVDYNHIVQSAIYNAIGNSMSSFLHEQGFVANGRVFRLFCFSRLMGLFHMDRPTCKIIFPANIQLVIVSPVSDFVQSLANGLLQQGEMRLGANAVVIESISAQSIKVEHTNVVVKTLSPVVVYSTMLRSDGRKYTVYFQPGDPDYDTLITANLQKKYKAFYGQEAPAGQVKVSSRGMVKMNVLQYKGTVIKGYSGILQLTGPQELLQIAVDCGLGSKNSQGMGCLRVQR